MDRYIDMHSHLDFADDYIDIAKQAQKTNITSLCSTVVPSSFVSARAALKETPCMSHSDFILGGSAICV